MDNPKITSSPNTKLSINNIINLSQKQSYSDLFNLKNETKPLQNFSETYKTFYPYKPEIGEKCFTVIKNSARFRNHELFMLWFPENFFLYKNTLYTILENKEGFLPLTWKVYLGIMAAATIRSEFLLKSLEAEFILMGGDEDWLVFGLPAAPEKIRKLEILNNILAHQPWKLKMQDIKDVCNFNGVSAWNIEDLVQSIIVLTTFHRLATVLESMRISVRKIEEKDKDRDDDKYSEISSVKGSVMSGISKVYNMKGKFADESLNDRKNIKENNFDDEICNKKIKFEEEDIAKRCIYV